MTLHRGRELRGCIGNVTADEPLAHVVARAAAAAATKDPRFAPLTREELPGLELEISVLSAPRQVDAAEEIEPTRHGVALAFSGRHAVLLPQVAQREGWDRATLLSQLCAKAGLEPAAWREPAAVLRIFTVETLAGTL